MRGVYCTSHHSAHRECTRAKPFAQRRTSAGRAPAGAEDSGTARALRESESCNSAILDGALDGVITMDHSGRVADFNPAAKFCEMTGYSSEELAEMTPADLDFAEDRAAVAKVRGAARRCVAEFAQRGDVSLKPDKFAQL